MSLPTFNFCFSYWNNKSISFFLISPQSLVSHWSKMSATGQPVRWALSSSNARPCFLWLPTSFWGCGLFWLSGATSVCRNSAFADYSSSFNDSFFLLCVSWEFGGTKEVGKLGKMGRHYKWHQQNTWLWRNPSLMNIHHMFQIQRF